MHIMLVYKSGYYSKFENGSPYLGGEAINKGDANTE